MGTEIKVAVAVYTDCELHWEISSYECKFLKGSRERFECRGTKTVTRSGLDQYWSLCIIDVIKRKV